MNTYFSRKSIFLIFLLATFLFLTCFAGYGINISNIEFRLKSSPGNSSTHEVVVSNDEGEPINVNVDVGDWYRKVNGANRFIEKNAARWQAPGFGLAEGESLNISYRAYLKEGYKEEFKIAGDVNLSRPDAELTVYGDSGYDPVEGDILTTKVDRNGPVQARRSIKVESRRDGVRLEVSVKITARESVQGITLSESFPVNTRIENLNSSGIPVEYVNRSAADWIEVNESEFSLDPGESRRLEFSIAVPRGVEGSRWAAIYVKSEPVAQDREGTTIVAIKRFAVKVYVTPPGTGIEKAYVTNFSAITRSIPKFELALVNEGNVELVVSGELRLRDEQGEVVDIIKLKSFKVLPGYRRKLIVKSKEATNLSPGKYNVLAVLDYGGENKIGKSISFKVKPLNLQPIGASPSLPKDPDQDGLYEDIDGNGSLERIDALVFSFNYDKDYIQANGRAFDFDLDGVVNLTDAEELMRIIQTG